MGIISFDITWESDGYMTEELALELNLYCQNNQINMSMKEMDLEWVDKRFKMFRASRVAGKMELSRLVCKARADRRRSELPNRPSKARGQKGDLQGRHQLDAHPMLH
jgi:hypothetical protein